jgi:hypothetical protein
MYNVNASHRLIIQQYSAKNTFIPVSQYKYEQYFVNIRIRFNNGLLLNTRISCRFRQWCEVSWQAERLLELFVQTRTASRNELLGHPSSLI